MSWLRSHHEIKGVCANDPEYDEHLDDHLGSLPGLFVTNMHLMLSGRHYLANGVPRCQLRDRLGCSMQSPLIPGRRSAYASATQHSNKSAGNVWAHCALYQTHGSKAVVSLMTPTADLHTIHLPDNYQLQDLGFAGSSMERQYCSIASSGTAKLQGPVITHERIA